MGPFTPRMKNRKFFGAQMPSLGWAGPSTRRDMASVSSVCLVGLKCDKYARGQGGKDWGC